ncbi:hypothetical protein TSUD_261160 [Trifolium subterraneum]|uniref:Isochorismatase-like domain-containing protein n=1 Tax=Trifolium subterraneum TaxID=3900 RepID=A0A2Z6LU37_TRISU|nr:hypothetical protein TSUD_261160 [Trifolium subterraneum]
MTGRNNVANLYGPAKIEGVFKIDPLGMTENWNKTALLVIDIQKDFIDQESPMRLKGAIDIVPNVIKAVEVARQRGIFIVWVIN